MKQIDARGLSCPQPVVLTNKAVKSGETEFEIIVNSTTSKENIIRMIKKSKLKAEIKEEGDEFIIKVSK